MAAAYFHYLIKGLTGESDANKDSSITLAELEMYVGSNVARETGNKQQPIFEGPNKYSTILARVSPRSPSSNGKPAGNSYSKKTKLFMLPIDSCNQIYEKLLAAINNKKFDKQDPQSATPLYIRLKKCSTDSNLIYQANSQLLGALMNETQAIANNSFIGQKLVHETDFARGKNLINQIIQNNDLQLPYNQHLNNLNRYFIVMENTTEDSSANLVSIDTLELIIDQALEEEPDAAYLLTAKSRLEMKRQNWEKAIELQEESLAMSPGWLTPKYYLGMAYANQKSYEKAMAFYEEVFQKDSLNQTIGCTKCALKNMADWAQKLNMDKKSQEYFLKAMQFVPETPEIPDVFENSFMMKMKDSIQINIEKMLSGLPIPGFVLDSMMANAEDKSDLPGFYYMRALQYKKMPGKEDSVIYLLKKAVEQEPDELYYFQTLLSTLQEQGKDKEIQSLIESKMKNYDPDEQAELKSKLAASFLRTKKTKEAFSLYKDLVNAGQTKCNELKALKKEFEKLPEYNQFMKTCKDKAEED